MPIYFLLCRQITHAHDIKGQHVHAIIDCKLRAKQIEGALTTSPASSRSMEMLLKMLWVGVLIACGVAAQAPGDTQDTQGNSSDLAYNSKPSWLQYTCLEIFSY